MINDKLNFYNIKALAKKTGLTRRTIHYYVHEGLLPKPEGGGRGHYYTEEHVWRIGLIQRWKKQGVPLQKMKELLSGKHDSRIAYKAEMSFPMGVEEESRPFNVSPAAPYKSLSLHEPMATFSTEEFVSETSEWTRMTLGPDVEISFRRGRLSRDEQQAIRNFIISLLKRK